MHFLYILMIVFLSLWLLGVVLYIPKYIAWWYGFKKTPHLKNDRKNRIAIVIAARGEERCIGKLFDSIELQTYDRDKFMVFLALDSDTPEMGDPQLEIAKSHLKKTQFDYSLARPSGSKGAALKRLFQKILTEHPDEFDAYIIVDADNTLTPNYVEEMNNALITKADVIIGKKLIKNWETQDPKYRTLTANLSALTYTGIDTMGNKYKSHRGYSLAICGQGLMLSKKFVDKFGGFPFTSLTEDVEVNCSAILANMPQFYYEHAQLYSEEPVEHKEYNKRRYRWLKGYFSSNKNYRKSILKETFSGGKIERKNLNFLFELHPVYIMIISLALAVVTYFVSAIVLSILGSVYAATAWVMFGGFLLLIYLLIAFFNMMLVLEEDTHKLKLSEKLKIIFLGPLYTVEYVLILIRVLNKNYQVSWTHVERLDI